jgi:hypothetical protein
MPELSQRAIASAWMLVAAIAVVAIAPKIMMQAKYFFSELFIHTV